MQSVNSESIEIQSNASELNNSNQLFSPLPYKKICITICPHCKYLEFPGCSAHQELFTFPMKELDEPHYEMACKSCIIEFTGNYYQYIGATHLSAPFNKSCRDCEKVRSLPQPILIVDPNYQLLLNKFNKNEKLNQ